MKINVFYPVRSSSRESIKMRNVTCVSLRGMKSLKSVHNMNFTSKKHPCRLLHAFSSLCYYHSPPILYLNILSFILPPVFRQVCATVYKNHQLLLSRLFIDSTHSVQPDSMKHGINKQPLDRVCSSRSFFIVKMSINWSICRNVVIILRPILRIFNSWF